MEQVIFGGYYDLLDKTLTEYNSLISGYTWTISGGWRFKPVSTDGVIKQLRVKLNDSPGVGKKYTFKLYVGGNPTALTFDIAGLDTTGGDMVNEIAVTAGDTILLQCVPDGNPTARYATWTCVFEGDTAAESLIMGGSGFGLNNAATEYVGVSGGSNNYSATENDHRQVIPTSGTIKNLYVQLGAGPGVGGDAYRFTVRLDGGTVAQSLIVTIVADDTSGSDLVHNLVVTAGDVLTMMIEPLNGPAETPYARWGMTFVADTDGESIVLGGSSNNLPQVDTEYHSVVPSYHSEAWTVNENERYHLGQVCTLKKLYILLAGSPGVGNKYDFTIRIAGAGSAVIATVDGVNTTGNSGALEDTVALDDYVDLEVNPDSNPTIRDAYWGFVCYTAPPSGSEDLLGKFSIAIPSASAEFLGEAVIRHVGTPVELLGKAVITHTGIPVELLGKGVVKNVGSTGLLGKAVIMHTGTPVELLGKADIRHVGTPVELLGKGIIRHPDTAELLGEAVIMHTGIPVELLGKGVVKNIDIAELLGRTAIRHVGTPVEFLGKAKIRHDGMPVELLGKTKIRHVGTPIELLGKFEAQATAELLGKGVVKNIGYAELFGKGIIRHVGTPVELLGKADVRLAATVEFLGKFVTSHSDHAGLLIKFEIRQDSADLFSHFEVGQNSIDLPTMFEVGQGAEELLGRVAIRHSASTDLKFSLYVSPWHLAAAEMLIGGRDRRMDLGGLDREMVVGGRDRRMKIK